MTQRRIIDLIRSLGVAVEYTDKLPPQRLGAYLDDERRILIRKGLTLPVEDETLHHEYAHAYYRDRSKQPAIERRAWKFAAQLIVDPMKYADAERVSTSSLYIAQELGTTTRIIETYREARVLGEIKIAA